MQYTRKAKATITIVVNGKAVARPVTTYQEASGRWFYAVHAEGKGVSVQYVLGNPQSGFWIGLSDKDAKPSK